MNQEVFNEYIAKVEQFFGSSKRTEPHFLIELIVRYGRHASLKSSEFYFFQGERYFYENHDEKALQCYLKARDIPLFPFFCYRTSALIYHKMRQNSKAIEFARKAQTLYSRDYRLLEMLVNNYQNQLSDEEWKQCEENWEHLMASGSSSSKNETNKSELRSDSHPNVSLGAHEMDELVNIFQSHHVDEEPLFEKANEKGLEASNLSNGHAPFQHSSCEHGTSFAANPTESSNIAHEKDVQNIEEILQHRLPEYQGFTSNCDVEGLTNRLYADATAKLSASFQLDSSLSKMGKNEATKSCAQPSYNNLFEQRSSEFQKQMDTWLFQYVENSHQNLLNEDHFIVVFEDNGRNLIERAFDQEKIESLISYLMKYSPQKMHSGFYIRWNDKGIVVNPGKNFVDCFHRARLHIQNIDFIIVTHAEEEFYSSLHLINELNSRLNAISNHTHLIHYYLTQKAYHELGRVLKPHYKHAPQTLHCLDFYLDSPDVEKIELCEGIVLHYFSTSTHGKTFYEARDADIPVGIRFELSDKKMASSNLPLRDALSIGYLSHTAWSPFLTKHLKDCFIVLAGFGTTNSYDFAKLQYQDNCLGYYGTYSLLIETLPRLLICCEFNLPQADIRLDVIKKLQQDWQKELNDLKNQKVVILPASEGFHVNLKTGKIKSSSTKSLVDISEVRCMASRAPFGPLQYFSSDCFI